MPEPTNPNDPQGKKTEQDNGEKAVTLEAITGVLDKFEKKLEARFGKLESANAELKKQLETKPPEAPPATPPKGEDDPPDATAIELRKMQERVKQLESANVEARRAARFAELRSELDTVSKDKLATNAETLIKKEFLSLVKVNDKDGSVSVEVDGLPYNDVSEAFGKWLAMPAHEGYRAPPPGSVLQSPLNPHRVSNGASPPDDFETALAESGVQDF